MTDDLREVRNALFVGLLVWLLAAGVARCDYVAAVGASWCAPCQQMRPIEDRLNKLGYDIRYIDIEKHPEWKREFKINRLPTFLRIAEIDGKQVECGRMVNSCSEQKLRQFCDDTTEQAVKRALAVAFTRIGNWIAA